MHKGNHGRVEGIGFQAGRPEALDDCRLVLAGHQFTDQFLRRPFEANEEVERQCDLGAVGIKVVQRNLYACLEAGLVGSDCLAGGIGQAEGTGLAARLCDKVACRRAGQ